MSMRRSHEVTEYLAPTSLVAAGSPSLPAQLEQDAGGDQDRPLPEEHHERSDAMDGLVVVAACLLLGSRPLSCTPPM
jgi:hypothetical protein